MLFKKLLPLVLGILVLAGCKKSRDLSKLDYLLPLAHLSQDAFVLAFTSNIEGYVEPCGCTADPLGGIARFTQVFEDMRAKTNNRISLIDTGNLLFDSPTRHAADLCQDNARIELLLSSLSQLGLKLTMAGPLDNARGEKYRTDWYKKFNLEDLSAQSIKILSANGYAIALIPLSTHENIDKESLKKTIQNILPLKETKKIKLVAVLSQLPLAKIKTLFPGMSDVDVIIQARTTSSSLSPPFKIADGGPWVIEGGRQGQYFTTLVLQNLSQRKNNPLLFDNRVFENAERSALLKSRIKGLESQLEKSSPTLAGFLKQKIAQANQELKTLEKNQSLSPLKESSISFNAVSLTRHIDSHHDVKNKLNDYEKAIPELGKKCEENIECPKASTTEASFVGAETCKTCHQQAYEVWQKAQYSHDAVDENGTAIKRMIGHSKAWKTLVEAHKDADRSCIGCHSVGFMQPGGYCKSSDVDFRKNIQCESCHGAGSLHAASGDKKLIGMPAEQTCRGCHVPPHIASYESFNYEERLMKILGPGHGELRLKELRAKIGESAKTH